MSANDPLDTLQDGDRTVLVPAPGGKRSRVNAAPVYKPMPSVSINTATVGQPAHPAASGMTGAATSSWASLAQLHGGGLNPLLRAANPLLDLVMPLRHMVSHPDAEHLRQQLISAIKAFERDAKAARIEHEAIAAARYSLCTLLDETISSTPWGGGGVWANRSLLVAFHNEAFGGEKFFLILQKLGQDVRANLSILELMYLCLALGLEGRYRVIEGGRSQLETLRERLQQLIQQQRGTFESELSLHWKGASAKGESLERAIPVWLLAAAAAALLITLQLFFGYRLNAASDPVFARLHEIKVASPTALPPQTPQAEPATRPVRVAGFLAPEIKSGLVSVKEMADSSIITLRGDGVFVSGSAEVNSDFLTLLQRIGDALKPVPGKIIVVGHTDNIKPGFSTRFPSNWDLSRGRAASVKTLLAERAGPAERYSVEGRGDTEPLVVNDSALNRARNRRVDIIVLTPAVAP